MTASIVFLTGAVVLLFVCLVTSAILAAIRVLAAGQNLIAAHLSDVAAAIRERGPDLHVQLRDVPPAAAGEPKP